MARKKIHRLSVYLLDPQRKKVLLRKEAKGPYAGLYTALSIPLQQSLNPMETIRALIGQIGKMRFKFLGHGSAMPVVLDENSVKLFPPLHVQLTVAGEGTEYVDFVYLTQLEEAASLPGANGLAWIDAESAADCPAYVRAVLHQIFALLGE